MIIARPFRTPTAIGIETVSGPYAPSAASGNYWPLVATPEINPLLAEPPSCSNGRLECTAPMPPRHPVRGPMKMPAHTLVPASGQGTASPAANGADSGQSAAPASSSAQPSTTSLLSGLPSWAWIAGLGALVLFMGHGGRR